MQQHATCYLICVWSTSRSIFVHVQLALWLLSLEPTISSESIRPMKHWPDDTLDVPDRRLFDMRRRTRRSHSWNSRQLQLSLEVNIAFCSAPTLSCLQNFLLNINAFTLFSHVLPTLAEPAILFIFVTGSREFLFINVCLQLSVISKLSLLPWLPGISNSTSACWPNSRLSMSSACWSIWLYLNFGHASKHFLKKSTIKIFPWFNGANCRLKFGCFAVKPSHHEVVVGWCGVLKPFPSLQGTLLLMLHLLANLPQRPRSTVPRSRRIPGLDAFAQSPGRTFLANHDLENKHYHLVTKALDVLFIWCHVSMCRYLVTELITKFNHCDSSTQTYN